MKIVRNEIIGFEPLRLKIVPQKPVENIEPRLNSFFQDWPRIRDSGPDLPDKGLGFSWMLGEPERDGSVELWAEWLSDESLDVFGRTIEERLGVPIELVVGHPYTPLKKYPPATQELLTIPRKEIWLEDGTHQVVEPFTITRKSITCGEFKDFVDDTGYVTTSEAADKESFWDNQENYQLRPADRRIGSVNLVSYRDAQAFCRWRGVRLPTEYEWLAAAVDDWQQVLSEEEHRDRYDRNNRSVFDRPEAFIAGGGDWVEAEGVPDGQAVARHGPYVALHEGWEQVHWYREILPVNAFDFGISFRVVMEMQPLRDR